MFGSFASGKATKDSDFDIAVAGDKPLTTQKRLALQDKLSLGLGREVDLIDLRTAHGPILKEALLGSQWIRRADSDLFAAILYKFWLDEADFGPIYRMILKKKRERFLRK